MKLMKLKHWIGISSLLVFVGLILLFSLGSEAFTRQKVFAISDVPTSYTDELHSFSLSEVTKLIVQNEHGNTYIEQVEADVLTIQATVRNNETVKPTYQLFQNNAELILEVIYTEADHPVDVTIRLPQTIQEIDGKSEFGNFRADIIHSNSVKLITDFGNIVTEFDSVNQQGEFTFVTNIGNIYTVLPDDTEISYQNPNGTVILDGVIEKKSAVRFVVNVRYDQTPIWFVGKSKQTQLAYDETAPNLTLEEMVEDYEEFILLLKRHHPNVKGNLDFFEMLFVEGRNKITKMTTREEYFHILNELLVATKDQHTGIGNASLINDFIYLPDFKYTSNHELLVLDSYGEFQKGDTIVKIGNKEVQSIFEAAKKIIPAEHEEWVKGQFPNLRSGIYLRKLNLVDDNNVEISFVRDGEQHVVNLPLSLSSSDLLSEFFETNITNPYSWYIDPSTQFAVLRIESFKYTKSFQEIINQFFKEVTEQNIHTIVIDVRDNPGGYGVVALELLSYIDFDPSDIVYNNFRHRKQKDYLFNGDIYVLTTNLSASASTVLALILQTNADGKLIGEPPGNTPSLGYNPEIFTLKNSNNIFSIPTEKPYPKIPVEQHHLPLTIDYPIEVTREAIMNDQDLWMEKVQELVTK
jgi:hypothetical protein